MGIKPWILAVFALQYTSQGWAQEEEKEGAIDPPSKMSISRQHRQEKEKLEPREIIPVDQDPFYNQIPYEIDYLTFSFLPTTTLLKFRSVDKYWKSIADDVIFHDRRQININVDKLPIYENFQFTLKTVNLKFVQLTGNYQVKFPEILKTLIHKDDVKKLSISGSHLGRKRLEYILPMLSSFKEVEILDVSENNITKDMLPFLARCFSMFKSLKIVDLSGNLIQSFVSPPWIDYVERAENLQMVFCSQQCKIVKQGKKTTRQKLDVVLTPSRSKTFMKLIFQDTPIQYDPPVRYEEGEEDM